MMITIGYQRRLTPWLLTEALLMAWEIEEDLRMLYASVVESRFSRL